LNVLIIGSGAREHVLAWKIAQSTGVDNIFVAPGNAGTALVAENIDVSPVDFEALGSVAKERQVDLVVVGPEVPLSLGIVDYFDSLGFYTFGPTKAAAQIESSKVFARNLMYKYGISCPEGHIFSSHAKALGYLQKQQMPVVIKADGLAAGKGTIIASSMPEAEKALGDIMEARVFGAAGDRVIIDEYLRGVEVSLLAFTDGKTVVPMIPACDYKKVGDGDEGLNTGGMGSYSPPGFFSPDMVHEAVDAILLPAVKAMADAGICYKGVLYAGLMVIDGQVVVIEFNARFGDPETQVILPLLKTDLVEILTAVIRGNLDKVKIEWDKGACVGVVMASGGYPGRYETGFPVKGLQDVGRDALIFHAGTKRGKDGEIHTSGGRVLTVVSRGENLTEAREKVYRSAPLISFEGRHYRKDIALRETQ
jgi:phosphoribosylamine---glycine ligase